ncbi:MAG: hypothetical protein WB988_14410 [Candidatus Nitrosopolaris sp.]
MSLCNDCVGKFSDEQSNTLQKNSSREDKDSGSTKCNRSADIQQDTSKANGEEISSCFQEAIKKLEKVDAHAKKEKTQIVQDLAKDLVGKIPT